jgi:hypothetical protein
MDTSKLKKFAQFARRNLIEQVQSKLKLVLAEESAARREHPKAIKDLEQKLNHISNKKEGEEQLVEQVAYTWFNRFCALRFMDVNQYNRIMVLSPISGQFQPEILAEAKAGHLDETVFNDKAREQIQGLLSGSVPSRDGQAEAYRLIIVAVCNDYHRLMPFLFQRIEDYTELLMPDDLLSGNSILAYTREAMTPENCESVESIGWLYQYYISEKKDQVFEGLKKNIKITPENIPAATQLFTPHWIVKYLIENSLGRLWMLNNPNSKVIEQMEYYIKPVEDEINFLKVGSPEELKLCDPAVGSGHMLTYAYDLLYAIYLDANYDPIDIPELILTKNLYGIEIDERAAELAAFALSMKAINGNPADDSNNRRRFFRNPIKPNICRLEKVKIDEEALEEYIEFAGRDLFTQDVKETLSEFEEADNFGSLIQPTLRNSAELLDTLEAKDAQVDLFLKDTHESILKILKQAKYLSPIYHVVTANPPYLGSKGMNSRMSKWAKDNYPDSKSDLFAMFMERNLKLLLRSGFSSMINMQSWMFLTSFERLRSIILDTSTISSMIHLGTRAFDSIGGEVVSTTAFVLKNNYESAYSGSYLRLVDGKSESEKEDSLKRILRDRENNNFYYSSAKDFKTIPGMPVAYWLSKNAISNCDQNNSLGTFSEGRSGMSSCNSDRFLRQWFEVPLNKINLSAKTHQDASSSGKKWYPYNKGGGNRCWYGYNDTVINWENEGKELKEFVVNNPKDPNTTHWSRRLFNLDYFFQSGISWSAVASGKFSCRYVPYGVIPGTGSKTLYGLSDLQYKTIFCLLNSSVASYYLSAFSPSLNFEAGDIAKIPVIESIDTSDIDIARLISIAKEDWSRLENTLDFTRSELLNGQSLLLNAYNQEREKSNEKIQTMMALEQEINRIFAKEYQLADDVSIHVTEKDVRLDCNPFYKYGTDKSESELEPLMIADSVKDFISYSVGCMFGRFSLDKNGFILANQDCSIEHYLSQVPSPSFMPDEDNVIPIIEFDGDWFEDDITERFKAFLKVTFGEENFTENLGFIEESIGKDIKKYFVKDFYTDHWKRYKKRPIYWMFSSPKGSFNAIIYMHRYQPDTASVVLNDYLREFRTKLEARKQSYEQVQISAAASQKDKTQAIKAIGKINQVLEEIKDYEHDVLYPLAGENKEIDLDNGVKHNYPLFGKALKKIPGLS